MRVLHVVQSLKGGPASYLNEILPDQVRQWGGASVALVVPKADLSYLAPELQHCRCFLFRDARRTIPGLGGFARATAVAYRQFRPDIVHLHSTFAGAVGRVLLVPRRRRPKIVYCAHGWAFDRAGSKLATAIVALERLLAGMTDAIINISYAEGRSASHYGVLGRRNVVIPNAIADRPWRGEGGRADAIARLRYDPMRINLLFVGRHDRQKGADIAEAAAALLPADHFHLYNIGGPVVGQPQALPPAGSSITRLGWLEREEVFLHMQAADVLIMPSRWEGFGLAAIEAMRAGVAVIASGEGALPEIVVDGETGRVVRSNAPAAYAEVLRSLDRGALAAMGGAGRLRFERLYRRDRLLSDLDGLYRSVVGKALDVQDNTARAG
jgi:glycosyltransferase involved in cell wall biosynthesis